MRQLLRDSAQKTAVARHTTANTASVGQVAPYGVTKTEDRQETHLLVEGWRFAEEPAWWQTAARTVAGPRKVKGHLHALLPPASVPAGARHPHHFKTRIQH